MSFVFLWNYWFNFNWNFEFQYVFTNLIFYCSRLMTEFNFRLFDAFLPFCLNQYIHFTIAQKVPSLRQWYSVFFSLHHHLTDILILVSYWSMILLSFLHYFDFPLKIKELNCLFLYDNPILGLHFALENTNSRRRLLEMIKISIRNCFAAQKFTNHFNQIYSNFHYLLYYFIAMNLFIK